MTVNPQGGRTAVLVAEPPARRREVHARLDAGGGKEMPEIVVRELWVPPELL
jgi:hypothetical protein